MNKDTLITIGQLVVQVLTPLLEAERARAAAAAAAANAERTHCLLCGSRCDALSHMTPRGLVCGICLRAGVQEMRRARADLHEYQEQLDRLLADLDGPAPRKAPREDDPGYEAELLKSFERALLDERGEDIQRELTLDGRQMLLGCSAPLTLDAETGARTLVVKVPPGTKDGTVLRLGGAGGAGTPPGDVLVTIRYRPPEVAADPASQDGRIQDLLGRIDRLERQLAQLSLPADLVAPAAGKRRRNA